MAVSQQSILKLLRKLFMSSQNCAAIILGAGKGTRMKSKLPKVLNPIAGQPMVLHVLDALAPLEPEISVVIVGPDMDDLTAAVAPVPTAVQQDQLGTADAVKAARDILVNFTQGTVFILYGDSPFISTNTLDAMLKARAGGLSAVVLGFEPDDPTGYGRLVLGANGDLDGIVEHKECNIAQLTIGLCNSGFMAIDAAHLFSLLDKITNNNTKGEFYLTDLVGLINEAGLRAGVIKADETELLGVDSKADLANAESLWQNWMRDEMMAEGVTLLDPNSVYFSHDTIIAADVIVEQNVVFGPGVVVEEGAVIKAFSHLEGAYVNAGADIGPYARLRPGANIGVGSKVGNFVEVKNATMGDGAKANHLSYIGDAEVGAKANIGAGTITCNYDGFLKSKTIIGEGAFIGSNSALVAPVTIGAGAIVGAGSTITKNIADDAVALTRAEQKERAGAASKFRKIRAIQKTKQAKNKSN